MKFLQDIENWNNHRPLLWLALQSTKGSVLELGMGDGSTPYLHNYCKDNGRVLVSFDNDIKYSFDNLKSIEHYIEVLKDWNDMPEEIGRTKWAVALIDHAPAEQRHKDVERLKDVVDIFVVHDAEHEGFDYDVYYISRISNLFKFRKDHIIPGHHAKTILLSNTIDVSKLIIPMFTLL